MKLLLPNKVYILRGNNEFILEREKKNSFLNKECIQKYGKINGTIVFEIVAKMFPLMPVMVLVDEHIACAHSGIPKMSHSKSDKKFILEQLYDLKQLTSNSLFDCAPAIIREVGFFSGRLLSLSTFVFLP